VSVPAFCRASIDSNGSRRGILACAGVELPLASSAEFVAACFLETRFAAGFTAGFAAGVPAGRTPAAGGAGVLAGGCPCACEHVAAAVSKIVLTIVITERIVRSFPLRAFQPLQAEFSLQLRELYSHQQAW
jgi:hypothetical protein